MTGLGTMTSVSLRRSRVLIGGFALVLTAMCYASAAGTRDLYATTADQVAAAHAINSSAALVALYGPILDADSLGELAMTKTTVTYAVLVMTLTITLVRRHTRVEEESGRAELFGALPLDPAAPLVSAVLVGGSASVLVAALAGIADVAGGLPLAGSAWFAASWLGLGLVGTGIGAVCAQLSASARTCGATAAGVVAAEFGLRALGDATSTGWLSWLSPLGWSTQLRAWSEPRGWVLLLDLLLATTLVGAALALRSHRDLGAGLVAGSPGRVSGSPRLSGPVALSLRLHAMSLLVWTVACAMFGAFLASIVPSASAFLDSDSAREMMERLGGSGAFQQTLVSAFVSMAAVLISCFTAMVIGQAGAEEREGRTEEVLATATSRSRAFVGIAVVALAGPAWFLLVTGAAMALAVNGSVRAGAVLATALVQVPAVWVVAALALAALSLHPSWAAAGWVLVVVFFVLGPLADLLRLPSWVGGLSPYSHVPRVPDGGSLAPELGLLVVAAALTVAACWCYRERDIG